MLEFFRAFAPLFEGFRERAALVRALLRSERTAFVLVCGPAEERVADALYFARRLREGEHQLGPLLVNRVHPRFEGDVPDAPGVELLRWLGERDAAGIAHLRSLLPREHPLGVLLLQEDEPASLEALGAFARLLADALSPRR
jgi:anion-transporting  ArsA/GET3 family ATPase